MISFYYEPDNRPDESCYFQLKPGQKSESWEEIGFSGIIKSRKSIRMLAKILTKLLKKTEVQDIRVIVVYKINQRP